MVLMIVIARPLFLFLYTDKWEISISYFQILCIGAMFYTMNTVNTNVTRSLGKGAVYFWIQFIKRFIGIVLILFSVKFGLEAILWAVSSLQFIFFIINATVTGRLINYGVLAQIKDVGGCYFISILAGGITYYLLSFFEMNHLISLISHTSIYSLLYLSLSYLFKIEGFFTYQEIVKDIIKKKKRV